MEDKIYKGKSRGGSDVWVNDKGENVCGVDGCFSTHRIAKGLCNKHYLEQVKNTKKHTCEINGYQCGGRVNLYKLTGQYLCAKHRTHIVKFGEIQPDIEAKPEKCTVEGCNEAYLASGYCNKHYKEFQYHGKIRNEEEKNRTRYCSVCNSSDKTVKMDDGNVYCGRHYTQIKKYGSILESTRWDDSEIRTNEDLRYVEIALYNNHHEIKDWMIIDLETLHKFENTKPYMDVKGRPVINLNGKIFFVSRYILGIEHKSEKIVIYKDGNYLNNTLNNLEIYEPHNMSGTSIYSSWVSLRERCNNKNSNGYDDYGGRGIKVCERWNDFKNFYEDMSISWFEGSSIDRIDVNGNYEPSNCRWATNKEQQRNRRNTLKINVNKTEIPLSEYLDTIGRLDDYDYIYARLRRGWELERAINTPKYKN